MPCTLAAYFKNAFKPHRGGEHDFFLEIWTWKKASSNGVKNMVHVGGTD
jgi:hypothetical protein